MKFAVRILSSLMLVIAALFYSSCGPDGPGDESEQSMQFKKLKSTWVVSSVTDHDGPRTDFSNVELEIGLADEFQENGEFFYELNGTLPNPSPWPKDGSWKFGTNASSQIIRDPDDPSNPNDDGNEILMSYELNSEATQLTLTFEVPEGGGWAGGKVKSVVGDWVFVFNKKQ